MCSPVSRQSASLQPVRLLPSNRFALDFEAVPWLHFARLLMLGCPACRVIGGAYIFGIASLVFNGVLDSLASFNLAFRGRRRTTSGLAVPRRLWAA